MRERTLGITILLCATIVATGAWPAGAGDVDPPPGPVMPTMKTMAEVEPRIPIHTADMPLTISTSGSYYFAEDITTAGDGITIAANDITIDLNGFTLAGGTGSGISGVVQLRVRVVDGVIRGWAGNGIILGRGARVERVTFVGNGASAIKVGQNSFVQSCIARENMGHGIEADSASEIHGNTCILNDGDGIHIQGFGVVTDNVATSNDGNGIWANSANLVSGNDCTWNKMNGITAGTENRIVGNLCSTNGFAAGGNGAGIHIWSQRNTIEGNTLIRSDRGIDVDSVRNFIAKNKLTFNTVSFDIGPGNSIGPMINVTSVGDISGTAGADHPWANFEY